MSFSKHRKFGENVIFGQGVRKFGIFMIIINTTFRSEIHGEGGWVVNGRSNWEQFWNLKQKSSRNDCSQVG